MKLGGVKLVQRRGNLDAELRGVQHVAIGHGQLHTVTKLAGIGIRRLRSKGDGSEAQPWEKARVQGVRQMARIDPGCAQLFKWRIGSAPYGNICRLYQSK